MFDLKTATRLAKQEAVGLRVAMVVIEDLTASPAKRSFYPARCEWYDSLSDEAMLDKFLVADVHIDGSVQTEWL